MVLLKKKEKKITLNFKNYNSHYINRYLTWTNHLGPLNMIDHANAIKSMSCYNKTLLLTGKVLSMAELFIRISHHLESTIARGKGDVQPTSLRAMYI